MLKSDCFQFNTLKWKLRSFLIGIYVIASGWGRLDGEPGGMVARGQHGLAVSVCPYATQAGVEILEMGGNAVDAAIAMEFVLAVTWPEAGNIGGGGFMMVHPSPDQGGGDKAVCIDYREKAPRAAGRHFFSEEDGPWSHRMVGVPGTVRGMEVAHNAFGSLSWNTLLQPAVRLARDGFIVDKALAGSINYALSPEIIRTVPRHSELVRVFSKPPLKDGRTEWQAGDVIHLPDLAATLDMIAHDGAGAFYTGPIARMIVGEMNRGQGVISMEDLAEYRAVIRQPVRGRYLGYHVYGPPPPSSGGICLIQMLQASETFKFHSRPTADIPSIHWLAEIMKRSFADRARFLGDSDFIEIPDFLTSREHAREMAGSIDMERSIPSAEVAPEIDLVPESPETTHFSVLDADGMAVSNTTTLEASWGARIVVQGAGFVLNNEMGDFNWFPGRTTRTGRIGTEPNTVAPGKRMLSSQTPVIVAQGDQPVLITGSPGGRTIINTVTQMVINVIGRGLDLTEAMRIPRMHHQWFPDILRVEASDDYFPELTVQELEGLGHQVQVRPVGSYQGDAHSIYINTTTGEGIAVADFRRRGAASAAHPVSLQQSVSPSGPLEQTPR